MIHNPNATIRGKGSSPVERDDDDNRDGTTVKREDKDGAGTEKTPTPSSKPREPLRWRLARWFLVVIFFVLLVILAVVGSILIFDVVSFWGVPAYFGAGVALYMMVQVGTRRWPLYRVSIKARS